ncbi:hypothetical protein [Dickeya undicola]|uniref:hypothetical protein n=1 Tax=Dickeya undicola TaxID=1577887 RepID=UPI001374EF6B|nr:hypothetical protein [Dickeya undicola]
MTNEKGCLAEQGVTGKETAWPDARRSHNTGRADWRVTDIARVWTFMVFSPV